MDKKLSEVLSCFTPELKDDITPFLDGNVQEIRLRISKPVCLMKDSCNVILDDIIIDKETINTVFDNICEKSVYVHQNEINCGFVTIRGGNRVGICGTAVIEDGKIISVKNISSLNFRFSRDFIGCSNQILNYCSGNIIIAGPPASGKTTLLRDIVRTLSNNGKKVCVVDERFEISGVDGEFELGVMTDCLRGYEKSYGISLAVRTLSPQIIVFDEIGSMKECESVFDTLNSGVNVITSVHCNSIEQFLRRPVCRKLIDSGFFENLVLLGDKAGEIEQIYKIDGDKICV